MIFVIYGLGCAVVFLLLVIAAMAFGSSRDRYERDRWLKVSEFCIEEMLRAELKRDAHFRENAHLRAQIEERFGCGGELIDWNQPQQLALPEDTPQMALKIETGAGELTTDERGSTQMVEDLS